MNWILCNFRANHVKNSEKNDFLSVKLVFLSLIPVETLEFLKFKMNQKKVIFPSIFEMVALKLYKIQFISNWNAQS